MLGDILKKNELKRQRFLLIIRKGIILIRVMYFSLVIEVNLKEFRMVSIVVRMFVCFRFEWFVIQLMWLFVVVREVQVSMMVNVSDIYMIFLDILLLSLIFKDCDVEIVIFSKEEWQFFIWFMNFFFYVVVVLLLSRRQYLRWIIVVDFRVLFMY